MTEVMLQDQGLGAERLSRLKLVYAAGQTMRAIVDDILDAAKIENGSLVLEEEPFTPAPTLEEVGELWRHNAMSKGLGFRTDLAACPPAFIGDEQRLRQIVYNLLSNAVKFTRSGEVALSVRMSGQDMLIEVADTGPGIPDEEREAIFAPFHQVNGARTRQHGGTGLGLFICRRLARAMGGDITLASALGQGSTFTLRLPAPTPADGPQTESPTALDMLALEPNPLNRCLLEAFCAEHGQSFQAAKDLDDALKALGAVKSQMILVAASALPKPQGAAMSALMALRDAAGRGRLVVWLDDEAGIAEATARLCGADAVLTGPFDAATALGQIQDAKAA
jgi:CheY-like chemotaxis protein